MADIDDLDLPNLAAFDEDNILASICRESFWEFCVNFWECIPGAGKPVFNWHMEYIASEIQIVAERVIAGLPKLYDLVINLPPGTSKSSLVSILFPAWLWTRMPGCRLITASHTSDLVLDLASKSRDVIQSEKYQRCFPGIGIREDTAAKGHYRNTQGGERKSCTVAGVSPIGHHAHILAIDDPIDPDKVLSEVELKKARKFIIEDIDTRKTDKMVSVTILVMQRLGVGDPSDEMLKQAEVDGSTPVKHICLPSDLDRNEDGGWLESEVIPQELAKRYVNGLLDPHRLPMSVLRGYKARGIHFYTTQFRQKPYSKKGGMFEEEYFSQRVKAAPYRARRVRAWDLAASPDSPGACYTAGVLMAIEKDGSIYVEHVVHGQWEPKRRDDIIKAVAMRDRSRYGPNNEPTILIEHEGGSAGISAYKATARHLAGFPVMPYRPTGKKEVRARPWSSQLAAKNVYLVDNGESQGLGRSDWNINEYTSEHLAFPLGRLKDQVDASAMAMTWLTDAPQAKGIRILSSNQVGSKGKELRLVVCRSSELDDLELDQRCLLLDLNDPVDTPSEPVTALELRSRLTTLIDNLELRFAPIDPAEYQDRWNEPIPDYGKPPDQLVLSRELGRKLWGFLLRKRDAFPEVVVIRDDDDGRALSVAYAICDMLRLLTPPEQGRKPIRRIYQVSDPERKHDADPPIRHVYAMVKATRTAVV